MRDVRAHLIIRGRVQGVFFRDSAQREAAARHLAGWIRNRPDDSVEAVFQGDPAAVETLIRWCHTGPPRARVTEVGVTWEPPVAGELPFRVH